jgi:hypothetical protein
MRFYTLPRPFIRTYPQDMEMGTLPERRYALDGAGVVRDEAQPVPRRWKKKVWWIVGTAVIVIGFWVLIVLGMKLGREDGEV